MNQGDNRAHADVSDRSLLGGGLIYMAKMGTNKSALVGNFAGIAFLCFPLFLRETGIAERSCRDSIKLCSNGRIDQVNALLIAH